MYLLKALEELQLEKEQIEMDSSDKILEAEQSMSNKFKTQLAAEREQFQYVSLELPFKNVFENFLICSVLKLE